MKISRRGSAKNRGDIPLLDRDDVAVDVVGSGVELKVRFVPERNSSTTAHDYTVAISRNDLQRIFDALLDAAEEEDIDL